MMVAQKKTSVFEGFGETFIVLNLFFFSTPKPYMAKIMNAPRYSRNKKKRLIHQYFKILPETFLICTKLIQMLQSTPLITLLVI